MEGHSYYRSVKQLLKTSLQLVSGAGRAVNKLSGSSGINQIIPDSNDAKCVQGCPLLEYEFLQVTEKHIHWPSMINM